jgi:acyl-CoA thioester hydrolase
MSDANVRAAWPHLAGRLEAGRHILPVRVYYEDTDFSGVVYHASYLRFMERGRSDMIRLMGVHHTALKQAPGGPLAFVARRIEVDFLKPARIDDVLEIETRGEAMSPAVLSLAQRVMRGAERLVEARVQIVLVGQGGRPQRLSKALPPDLPGAFLRD